MNTRNFVWFIATLGIGFFLGWFFARGRSAAAMRPAHADLALVSSSAPLVPASLPSPASSSPSARERRLRLLAEGNASAQTDLASALRRLEAATDPAERSALLEGIFGQLAEGVPPAEALRHARALQEPMRHAALRVLALEWLGAGGTGELPKGNDLDSGFGMVANTALWLNSSKSAPAGAAKAWLDAFADHPARSMVAGAYASAHVAANPHEALALAKDFTPWERQQFLSTVLPAWALTDHDAALAWARTQNEPLPESVRRDLFAAWARADSEDALAQLATLADPAERLEAARALGQVMAGEKGTYKAVAWADSLTDPALRQAANDAIYEETPRGIGAILRPADGFPTLAGLLPGSAAEQAGLQPGDRLVEIAGATGNFTSLYGLELAQAVAHLRGDPGDLARLRVLRTGPDGRPVEQILQLQRQQLVFPPPKSG